MFRLEDYANGIDKIIAKYMNLSEASFPNAVTVVSDKLGIIFKPGDSAPVGQFIKNRPPSGWEFLPLNSVWKVKSMGSVIMLQSYSDMKIFVKLDSNALNDALRNNALEEFKGSISAAMQQDKDARK